MENTSATSHLEKDNKRAERLKQSNDARSKRYHIKEKKRKEHLCGFGGNFK